MIYRLCRRCGLRWNVSRKEPGGKRYVCPLHGETKRAAPRAGTSEGGRAEIYFYTSSVQAKRRVCQDGNHEIISA